MGLHPANNNFSLYCLKLKFKKVFQNFKNFIPKCFSSPQESKTYFSRFLDGSEPLKSGHVNRSNGSLSHLFLTRFYHGCHSKVTSLQALLRKAFRSPGVLVLGDFGIFCLFLPAIGKNKPKILTCFA